MKKILTNLFAKLAMVAVLATAFAGSAWAETYTLGWGTATGTTGTYTNFTATSGTVNGILSFSTAKNSSSTAPAYNSNSSELRLYFHSGGNGGSITLTPAEGITITGFVMTTTTAPSVKYTVDGGSATSVSASNNTYTVTGISASNSIMIQNVNTTNTQLRIKTIQVTYTSGSGSSAVATTTTISASGITNTDVYLSTAAGSLSATVKDANDNTVSDASVTWSGNNDAVATINASTGAVTLVSAGSVTFTATYDGKSGEYIGSSATYNMTVTSSAPYVQPTEITITPNYTFWGKNAQFSGSTYDSLLGSEDNVSLEWSRGEGSTYANQNAMRFYKENELTFTAPSGYEIKSIELSVTGTYDDLTFSPAGWDSQSTKWTGSSETVTMSRPSNASSYATISKFTITIGKPSTDPVISANDIDITYDATGGNIAFTVENPVNGGSVSASTDANWLTPGSETTSPISFTCSANSENTARTATVTLTYTYDSNKTVTKDVTVTQAAAPVIYSTIPALFNVATSTETNVTIAFGGWVVSAVHNKNAYLTDNQGHGLIIYADGHGFQVNDVLTGTVSCGLQLFRGSAELTNLTTSSNGLTVAHNGTVTAQNIAISNLGGVNTGALLTFEGLSYNGTVLVDGDNNTITPYSTLYSGSFTSGKSYNVSGIYLQYNDTKELLPRSADDIEEVVIPSITVTPATVDASASAEAPATYIEGTLPITYTNLPIADFDDFDIQLYDSNGDPLSDNPDWIIVETAEDNGEYLVSYVLEENTGAARSAYFKVYAMDNESNLVYSNLVTITQAAYVAPPTGEKYALYTGEIVEGNYIIYYNGSAMNTTVDNDRLQYVDIEPNNNVITTDNAAIVWHIAPSGEYWTIYNADADAYAASTGAKNKAQMLSDGTDDKALWTVSGTETYEFVNKKNTDNGVNSNLRKNSTYGFACYATSTGGALTLYKNVNDPVVTPEITLTLAANKGLYWGSFYNGGARYALPKGAKAYTLNASHELYLLGDGSEIPVGTAVIIIADSSSITLKKSTAPDVIEISGSTNILVGADSAKAVSSITGTPYVLGIVGDALGFYKYTGDKVPAMRAYYIVNQ